MTSESPDPLMDRLKEILRHVATHGRTRGVRAWGKRLLDRGEFYSPDPPVTAAPRKPTKPRRRGRRR